MCMRCVCVLAQFAPLVVGESRSKVSGKDTSGVGRAWGQGEGQTHGRLHPMPKAMDSLAASEQRTVPG